MIAAELPRGDPDAVVRAGDGEQPAMAFVLRGIADDGRRATWSLQIGQELVIGRGPACDVRVQVTNLSRVHARVGADGDGPWVQDAQSSGGTFVDHGDGPRHIGAQRVRLQHGDRVQCGNQVWAVEVAG